MIQPNEPIIGRGAFGTIPFYRMVKGAAVEVTQIKVAADVVIKWQRLQHDTNNNFRLQIKNELDGSQEFRVQRVDDPSQFVCSVVANDQINECEIARQFRELIEVQYDIWMGRI